MKDDDFDVKNSWEYSTKALKKKDAPFKPDFDSLPVVRETKLKKGFKALVLSFHSQRCAAL